MQHHGRNCADRDRGEERHAGADSRCSHRGGRPQDQARSDRQDHSPSRRTLLDNDDAVEGIVQSRKGSETEGVLRDIHAKVKFINDHVLPKGVKIVPHMDRDDLVHFTTHTVFHNLTEGILLVVSCCSVSWECALIADCGGHHSVLVVLRRDSARPESHSREPVVAGRAGFRHDRGRRSRDGGEHPTAAVGVEANVTASPDEVIRAAAHEVQRPVFYAIAIIIITYLPIFTLQRVEGRLFQSDGMDRCLRSAGVVVLLHPAGAGARRRSFPQRSEGMAQSGAGAGSTSVTKRR